VTPVTSRPSALVPYPTPLLKCYCQDILFGLFPCLVHSIQKVFFFIFLLLIALLMFCGKIEGSEK